MKKILFYLVALLFVPAAFGQAGTTGNPIPPYSTQVAYNIGDQVIFNGALYQGLAGGTPNVNKSPSTTLGTFWQLLSANLPVTTVAFSATPAFVATNPIQTITLTANVTSSTMTGIAAGQRVVFQVCQNATGGFTFVWPTNIHGGMTIGTTASTCSQQAFTSFSGTTLEAESTGISNIAP